MSSRKSNRSSSRASSRKSRSINNNSDNFQAESKEKKTLASRIPHTILLLAVHGSILYYLYNLEDADCNCIRDWRHNFIKGMSILIIFLNLISLFGFKLKAYKWLMLIQFILFIIDIYAFFTYIGDLNATQCSCAVNKQPNLNSIMNLLRWVYPVIIGLSLLAIIACLIFGCSFYAKIE